MSLIVVFASGEGTNFQFLADKFKDKIALLICNQKNAKVLSRAQKSGVPSILLEHCLFTNRKAHEHAIIEELIKIKNLQMIVLAGYMRILSPYFFERLPSHIKIVNLHPAHLHDYKGEGGYAFAIAKKFPRWGITLHEVIPELDSGPIIDVCEIPVFPTDTQSSLRERAKFIEHHLLEKCLKTSVSMMSSGTVSSREEIR